MTPISELSLKWFISSEFDIDKSLRLVGIDSNYLYFKGKINSNQLIRLKAFSLKDERSFDFSLVLSDSNKDKISYKYSINGISKLNFFKFFLHS